jgi:hypothetical protein
MVFKKIFYFGEESKKRVITMVEVPNCCGKPMRVVVETGTYHEVQCDVCKDTVFLKKEEADKPQLIDD